MSKTRGSSTVKVFISHSHHDRHLAYELQSVLEGYGAETFFDQDDIQIADELPSKIREGLSWCDILLLLWSANAASSDWVMKEWNMAYDLRKKIVPYVLDGTPLPNPLDNLVYLEVGDREHADAKLLRTIIGPVPPPPTLFPGRWQASVDALGMGGATFELELRENGQVEGTGRLSKSGLIGGLADETLRQLMEMDVPIHGSWSYDQVTKVLTLETSTSILGQKQDDTVKIKTTGREKAIVGEDLGGRSWKLQRVERVDISEGIKEIRDKSSGTPAAHLEGAFTYFYALGAIITKVAEMGKPGSYTTTIPWAIDSTGQPYHEPMELTATRSEDYRDAVGQTVCEITVSHRYRDKPSGPPRVSVQQCVLLGGQWKPLKSGQQ